MSITNRFSFFAFLFFSLACFMLSSSLSAKELFVAKDDDGKTINLHVGDTITLSLGGNVSTGFAWIIESPESPILKLVAQHYEPFRLNLPGSPGLFYFSFLAGKKGSTFLILEYARSWEKDIPAADTYRVKVNVE